MTRTEILVFIVCEPIPGDDGMRSVLFDLIFNS